MKNKVAIFALFLSLFGATPLFASIEISEVMYDLEGSDTKREWVELHNTSDQDLLIDASLWRFFDGTSNRTINGEDSFTLLKGAYVVLTVDKETFLNDYPNFSGTVYDTGMSSLNNTGAILKLLDQDENTVNEFAYASNMGANGDGKSLQKVSGVWVAGTPTPGKENGVILPNTNTDTANDTEQATNTNSGTTFGGSASLPPKKQSKILVEIISPKSVFTGLPFEMGFKVTGLYGESLNHGKLYLNFGNGVAKEIKPPTNTLTHTYKYAGEYIVRVEYFENEYNQNPDAKSETRVSARPATVVIASVGNSADFFVELKNIATYDIDISGWVLAGVNRFVFPKNTILSAGESLLLGPEVTLLGEADKQALKLLTPLGNIVFDYGVLATPINTFSQPRKTVAVVNAKTKSKNSTPLASLTLASNNIPDLGTEIKGEELVAKALSTRGQVDSFYLWLIGLVLLIGLGAGLVFFIRTSSRVKTEGDDFEILEG